MSVNLGKPLRLRNDSGAQLELERGGIVRTLTVNASGVLEFNGTQNMAIVGGSINGTPIGGTTASTGAFTTVSASTSVTTPLVTRAGTLALSATGANVITASTNGVERLRITSAGNVGIGTTAPNGRLDVRGGTIQFDPGSGADATRAFDFNIGGANFAKILVPAGSGGALAFWVGTSNSATERLRITSDGNVGIGTSSILGGARTEIRQNADANYSSTFTTGTTKAQLVLRDLSDVGTYATPFSSLLFGAGSVGAGWSAISGVREASQSSALTFATASGSGNPTERMRITSAGNVGIGTTSPNERLEVAGNIHVSGADRSIFNRSNNALTFGTNNTERMRIDAAGRLIVGGTSISSSERVNIAQNLDASQCLYLRHTGASQTGQFIVALSTRAASSAFSFADWYADGVAQFRVRGDGVILAQNTTVQSISDARTKENIKDSKEGLNVISALRPVRFDFKAGFGNDRKNQLGFVAQEVETVFPDAVGEWEQDGEVYKSVGPSALIPVLVKAVQEQQAIIESLKARLDAANL